MYTHPLVFDVSWIKDDMLTKCVFSQGSDPGVKINIYWPPVTSYTVPGPSVFTC